MRKWPKRVRHSWVIDFDVHQANGVARHKAIDFRGALSLVDLWCSLLFPFDKKAERHIDVSVDVCEGMLPQGNSAERQIPDLEWRKLARLIAFYHNIAIAPMGDN